MTFHIYCSIPQFVFMKSEVPGEKKLNLTFYIETILLISLDNFINIQSQIFRLFSQFIFSILKTCRKNIFER